MRGVESAAQRRKRLGQWATPPDLVEAVVAATIVGPFAPGQRVRVLDPACGDGRFVFAAARRVAVLGGEPVLTGVDIDASALARAADEPRWSARWILGDALAHDWRGERFDVVVGNPPFVSQLVTATSRRGASRLGGGAYADVAAEFLALAVELAEAGGGRIGLVLPQSILASRDVGPVRAHVDAVAALRWCWWSDVAVFDAAVLTCAIVFERGGAAARRLDLRVGPSFAEREPIDRPASWASIVVAGRGVPALPPLATAGLLGDRADAVVDFRDQYYGLVGAVGDDVDGPPLVTSGLIDVGRCAWGLRPVRFAKQRFAAPRVAIGRLDEAMQRWASARLVPKVLVANQTSVIEAVVDREGSWLPGVPVVSVVPRAGTDLDELAALLTSPVATAWAWHEAAGTGLSANTIRVGPRLVAGVPWPAASLAAAVDALRAGDVAACGREVAAAFGVVGADAAPLTRWWLESVQRRPDPPPVAAEPGSR
jgi:SAM-dependent methyltransferase